MIRILFLFAILAAGLFVGTQYSGQQGYVLISIADKTLEMSVTTLVVLVIVLLALLFLVETLVKKSVRYTSATWNYFSIRKLKRARRYTNEGIIKLVEGDWKAAEKKVTRWSNHHDKPLLCYLVAAEAAHAQGKIPERDKYLEKAAEQPDSDLAVGLTKAKQHIGVLEYELAFDVLSTLRNTYPDNPALLKLIKQCYVKLELWQPLYELIPALDKKHLLEQPEQIKLTQLSQSGKLKDVANQEGTNGLVKYWDGMPRKQRKDPVLIESFVRQLIERHADSTAYTLIKETIAKHPEPTLFQLIPELQLKDRHPVIQDLEKYTSKHPEQANGFSALGQLYLHEEEWSKAQQAFESALKLRSDTKDYAYLSDALHKQNYTNAANEVAQKALALVDAS
jgi:HemY protein